MASGAKTKAAKADGPPQQQTWFGFDASPTNWSAYSGTTYALFGNILDEGFRLRVTGGYGRYSYVSTRRLGNTMSRETFKGQHGFGALMAGYQWQWGPLTLKGFAGGASSGHVVTPFDPGNASTGARYGFAAALEAWYDFSPSLWASGNLGWSSIGQEIKADLRLGYRITRSIDLGAEAAGRHDTGYANGRVGAFAQYKWGATELRASGGWTLDQDGKSGPYGALNLLLTY